VRPYAERIGAAIGAEPAFTVRPATHGDRAEAARHRITELLADPAPMVICAHRENIPVLLGQARSVLDDSGLDDRGPGGAPSTGDQTLPKGGFDVLHVAGRRIVAVERHDLRPARPA
jgi:hypothetical protein